MAGLEGAEGEQIATQLAPRLLRWHRTHGRHDLPWQRTRDPYRVWLSEIMLQQTQVATVMGYYDRFLQRFPDVGALAAAPLDEVLALWSGLGYYSRARNLHRCAQAVAARPDGQFPGRSAELAELPGIGRSTAAAIAAFCFGERVAILDGNVKRVLSRVLAFDDDLAGAPAERRLWDIASQLVPAQGVEAYTQAVMDLGATVCRVREPACADCPLAPLCRAQRAGQATRYPVKSRRLKRGRRCHVLLWLVHGQRLWLVRRAEQGVWAGLWSLPEFDDEAALMQITAAWPGEPRRLPALQHALTHFDWELQPMRWTLPQTLPAAVMQDLEAALRRGLAAPQEGGWFSVEQALAMGLPAPVRRLIETGAEAQPAGQA